MTTVERTIRDLMATHADGGHLGGVLDDALRRNLVDVDRLAPIAASYAPVYGFNRTEGRLLLQHLLDQAGTGTSLDRRTAHAITAHARAEASDASTNVQTVASQLAGLDQTQLRNLRAAVAALIQESDRNSSKMETDE